MSVYHLQILFFLSYSALRLIRAQQAVIAKETVFTPPKEKDGSPVKVYVGFYVESMGSFKATEMAFDVDLYLRLSWYDQRLRHNETGGEIPLTNTKALNRMWIPDLYFKNARKSQYHSVTVPNLGGVIFADGTVALTRRITMSVACNMDLKQYPIDHQTCMIKISSFANNATRLNLTWFTNKPIYYNQNINLPELTIVSMTPSYCPHFDSHYWYPVTEHHWTEATFGCLSAEVYLKRSITYHLVQSYIPTALIVIISWVSFWIDQNAVPARVSLSFTTLLTLSTMGAGLRYSLPAVSYAKAIDYWYGVCMLFVFAALLEFAVVNSLVRSSKKCESIAERLSAVKSSCKAEDFVADAEEYGVEENTPPPKKNSTTDVQTEKQTLSLEFKARAANIHRKALNIDRASRAIFPMCFAVFLIVYWLVYGML